MTLEGHAIKEELIKNADIKIITRFVPFQDYALSILLSVLAALESLVTGINKRELDKCLTHITPHRTYQCGH